MENESGDIMRFIKISVLFIMLVLLSFTVVYAKTNENNETTLDGILNRYSTSRDLTDWESLVLGINGVKIKTPWFTTPYFKKVEKEVAAKNGEYRLVTDYARIALVYKSHGKDPSNVAGYDFIEKIKSFKNMQNQGLNAYTWALIALYGQDRSITDPLVEEVLTYRQPSGGFGTSSKATTADPDLTAMAITALAPYTANEEVRTALDPAIAYLSAAQTENGAFIAHNTENAETVAQVIVALCAAGVKMDDARFIKNGHSLPDALQMFALPDGSYAHVAGGTTDPIATRQAALALSALRFAMRYDAMTDTERAETKIRRGIFEISGTRP